MIIQTVLLFFGIGGHSDADADGGTDIDVHDLPGDTVHDGIFGDDVHADTGDYHIDHVDGGLKLLTFRGIIAFFAVMGWTGIVLVKGGGNLAVSVSVAAVAGFCAMLLIALCMRLVMKMQSNGTMNLHYAVGVSGTVYIPIPPERSEKGKINILLQGQYTELSAVTDEKEKIPSGKEITVIGLSGGDTVLVKRK